MKRIRTLWAPLLLCGLLLAIVVGAVSARTNSAPLSSTTNTLSVAASDCYPYSDEVWYENEGDVLMTWGTEIYDVASFICPIRFPEYGTHTISQITMYAYDNKAGRACLEAARTRPYDGEEDDMVTDLCTSNSTADPQTRSTSSISNSTVGSTQGMYLWVTMGEVGDPEKLVLYGFRISYSVGAP